MVSTFGNWKIINDDGSMLVKVIGFPSEDPEIGGESMWVQVKDGSENSGCGYLRNMPTSSRLKMGDLVRFDGGTYDIKPHFIEALSSLSSPRKQYDICIVEDVDGQWVGTWSKGNGNTQGDSLLEVLTNMADVIELIDDQTDGESNDG